MAKITKDTLIPLGLAISMIGGAAGWVTKQEMALAENSKMIVSNSKRIDSVVDKFQVIENKLFEISERLGRIEGQLKLGR